MLFKPLPQNLDFYVIQDHLFQTLRKNKFTQELVNLRAEEIVKSLLKECLTEQIAQKYHEVCLDLEETQQDYNKLQVELRKALEKQQKKKLNQIKDIKSTHETIITKTTSELQTKDSYISNLQYQISQLEQQFNQLHEQYQSVVQQNVRKSQQMETLSQARQQLGLKNESLTRQLEEVRQRSKKQVEDMLFSHQEQMNRNFTKIKTLNNSMLQAQAKVIQLTKENQQLKLTLAQRQLIDYEKITKHQSELKKSYRQIQSELKKSHKQIQKLKKQLTQSEQNYSTLKKQITKFQDKYKSFHQQYNSMRLSYENQQLEMNQKIQHQQICIQTLQSEIKQLTIKNDKLNTKNTTIKNALQKLQRHLSTSLVTLKQQNLTLRSFLRQSLVLVKQYSQTSLMKVVNHISQEVSAYFQQCVFEIKKAREQKNLAKQQARMKTEVIEHLDRLLNGEAKSVQELRYELREKIMEEEKLRRKLKSHYHQTDKKLEEFQSKYISILKNDF